MMKRFYLLIPYIFILNFIFSVDSVKLTFAGDLMAHDVNFRTKPLSEIYKGVLDTLQNDDLSFVNLEFPIDETREQSSYPSFNVSPTYVEAAIVGGFDVFSLGNNHTNDFGFNSLIKTIENMEKFKKSHFITYSGVYGDSLSRMDVETIQVKDLTIGYLSITQFSNNFWNKEGAAKIYTVDYKSVEKVNELKSFITNESKNYDCFILSYHGGIEYRSNPTKERIDFFDQLIKAGVDILWAHHPHVLQPWKFNSTDSGDKLIMYSMGNFISGQLAIVDPKEHDINFAATGFSALFNAELVLDDGKLRILNPGPKMIANVRNKDNYFVAVNKEDALSWPMSDSWKEFYSKMFPVAENRIRKD
ncbi:CapA family protein [Thiospirochaeta perfilievii]|uniref:CapA family protein n=1 Tax=Thiospirochaeta perfilievii TaxID=252967 RepID=A0A5C1QA01_9SPIO|nr:CapA family protein [Thiospirochaeta perfilievii]QEN04963.1 CapA family protein [Thiospirochaeta perfilievii]